MNINNRILVLIDESNFVYCTLFGAVSKWMKSSTNADAVKPIDETDQENLPNLLAFDDFKTILNNQVQKRLEGIDWILKENHQSEIDECEGIDYVFSQDDNVSNSFRKKLYPQYKAQRKLVKRQYDVGKIREYVINVAMDELDLSEKYGYSFIKIHGCESDDIIASIAKNFKEYRLRIIFSSDHDFLQIPEVVQYDMFGNKIERVVSGENISEDEFLLWKIIRGDDSDNISGVFRGVGEKKSLKLVRDRKKLMDLLKENQNSANQFKINSSIIDFKNIPSEMESTIVEDFREKVINKINSKCSLFDLIKDFDGEDNVLGK